MMDFNEIDPLWKLADTFTVTDAAALVAGFDPKKLALADGLNPEKHEAERQVSTVFSALTNAITAGRFRAKVRYSSWERGWDEEPGDGEAWSTAHQAPDEEVANALIGKRQWIRRMERDWVKTTIDRQDLIDWLANRGLCTGFFFPNAANDAPDYLDPKNPRYAPKLAAAVRVWQAMEDENLLRGKGTILAMEQWLESRYRELGLMHEKDNPKNGTKAGGMNQTAIEEAAKVANWRTSGGATKTPGG